jgi:hypothetical protein
MNYNEKEVIIDLLLHGTPREDSRERILLSKIFTKLLSRLN